jgi:hypothetical protein
MSRHGGQLQYIPWPDEEDASPALYDTRKLLPRSGTGAGFSAAAAAATAAVAASAPTLSAAPFSAQPPLPAAHSSFVALGVVFVLYYLLAPSGGDGPGAAALPAAPLVPMSALPGMGPSGPIVGSWGLTDAVLPHSLTFLAIGDWGRDGKGGQEVTAPVLEAWGAATRAAFVVSVGDNVYVDGVPPGGSAAEADAILKRFFSNVYSTPYLSQLPFHVILGNHVSFDASRPSPPNTSPNNPPQPLFLNTA